MNSPALFNGSGRINGLPIACDRIHDTRKPFIILQCVIYDLESFDLLIFFQYAKQSIQLKLATTRRGIVSPDQISRGDLYGQSGSNEVRKDRRHGYPF